MSETMTLSIPRPLWDRYNRLASAKNEDPLSLMEKVLVTYLENEETENGAECNVNWLGFGSVEPC